MTKAFFDILIIGGGVIGLSLARRLAREKTRVAVIDAGAAAPGASAAAAGMLAPSFERPENGGEALYTLAAAALSMWPSFAEALQEETGLNIDYRSEGILGLAYDEAGLAAFQRASADIAARGGRVRVISGEEARRMEPALSPGIIAALDAPDDAQVDPRKLLRALRQSFTQAGGRLVNGRVLRVERAGPRYSVMVAGAPSIEAEKIVLASGAAVHCAVAGLPAAPVYPAKGEAVALCQPALGLHRVIRAPGAYICPKADGRVIIGASEYSDRDDLVVDEGAIAALLRCGTRAVGALSKGEEIERWAGLRPGTPDGAPILGADRNGPANVYLALGHYRNGILLAPASAEILFADIAGADAPAAMGDLHAFRPERFRNPPLAARSG